MSREQERVSSPWCYGKIPVSVWNAAEPYTQLLEKFAQAALKHDEGCLVAKGAEGLHSLMLCAGAYYSACKGIRVDLPLDAVRYKELMDNLIEDEKVYGCTATD